VKPTGCQDALPGGLLMASARVVVNVAFMCDIVLHFFISFDMPENNRRVRTPFVVIRNYLCGWFLLDVLSVCPWNRLADMLEASGGCSVCSGFMTLGLLRCSSIRRLSQRYASRNDMPISRLRLMKLMITLTLSFHWMACLWGFLLTMERQNGWYAGNTWADKLRSAKPGLFVHPTRDTPFELYTASLYWSAMTVTSIGYGDVTPNNVYEAWLAVLVMAFTGLVWAHIIGGICAICTSLDIEAIDLETKLDSLNVVLSLTCQPQLKWFVGSSSDHVSRSFIRRRKWISCGPCLQATRRRWPAASSIKLCAMSGTSKQLPTHS